MGAAKEVGCIINELRKKKGMTQKELACQLYVSPSTVSKWENGDSMPDIYMLKDLAEIFQVSVSELIEQGQDTASIKGDSKEEHSSIVQAQTEIEPELILSKHKGFKSFKMLVSGGLLLCIFAIVTSLYIYMQKHAEPVFRIVDEFYDDTSKHRDYDSIYHIVVEYEGELVGDSQFDYARSLREEYSVWFDKAEVIKVSYFEHYKERSEVYNTECYTFLLPRNE